MNFLALDIATATGWAQWLDKENVPTFGAEKFDGTLGQFADAFERWLLGRIDVARISYLAIEAPVPVVGATNLNTLMRAYGAHMIVHKICARRSLPLHPVNVSQWRTFFIGASRAPKCGTDGAVLSAGHRRAWLKKKTIEECRTRGWEVKSDDAADALGILDYVRSMRDLGMIGGDSGGSETIGSAAA